MASSLVWMCVRNNSSFLIKRDGAQFTTEPNNLVNRNSLKFSGLTNSKALGVSAADKGVVLTKKSAKSSNSRKPSKAVVSVTLKRDFRRVAKSIKNAAKGYRSELTRPALARAAALFRAQRVKAAGVKPKAQKKRSQKKTA